eukprot:NODE_123_length_17687_cov_0.732261.p8 type:complete len:269 gc:universal NODE_123_length_17687_cov_0.732261:16739-17545(+)
MNVRTKTVVLKKIRIPMVSNLIISLTGFALTVLLCILTTIKYIHTFKKKRHSLSYLIIFGILASICHSAFALAYMIVDKSYGVPTAQDIFLDIVISTTWLLMLQIESWLYVRRISSLGNYMWFDKYLKYSPFVLLVMQLPVAVGIGFELVYIEDFRIVLYALLVCISVVIIIAEVVLDIFLIQKLKFILEYRKTTLGKLCKIIFVMCCFAIIFELGLIVACILKPVVYISLRPFICTVKIFLMIEFYSKLLSNKDRYPDDSFLIESST